MTEDELLEALESHTLAPELFTHTEHVHLAWTCLRRHPLLVAMAEFRRLLTSFATHVGKPCLYHETVTFAYLLLVYERMARNPAVTDWITFARENPDLLSWKDGPFFRFYGADVLNDRTARFCFVLPQAAAEERRIA